MQEGCSGGGCLGGRSRTIEQPEHSQSRCWLMVRARVESTSASAFGLAAICFSGCRCASTLSLFSKSSICSMALSLLEVAMPLLPTPSPPLLLLLANACSRGRFIARAECCSFGMVMRPAAVAEAKLSACNALFARCFCTCAWFANLRKHSRQHQLSWRRSTIAEASSSVSMSPPGRYRRAEVRVALERGRRRGRLGR